MLVQPSNPQNSSFLPLEIFFSLVYGAKKYKGPQGSSNLQKFTLAPQITAGDGLKASVGHTIHTKYEKNYPSTTKIIWHTPLTKTSPKNIQFFHFYKLVNFGEGFLVFDTSDHFLINYYILL